MAVLRIATAVALLTVVAGHSTVLSPVQERIGRCVNLRRDCGPCMDIERWEDTGKSERSGNVAATWSRGQEVRYVYERNNHDNGFAQIAIVPVKYRMNFAAHERFTFLVHCYAAATQRCPSRKECGTDEEMQRYVQPFTVPRSIPDGVYHFSWMWYGGGDTSQSTSFGTYYSCSYIKIEGGGPVQARSPITFVANRHPRASPGKCATNSLKPRKCTKNNAPRNSRGELGACPNFPVVQGVPLGFTGEGESGRYITPEMYGGNWETESSPPQKPRGTPRTLLEEPEESTSGASPAESISESRPEPPRPPVVEDPPKSDPKKPPPTENSDSEGQETRDPPKSDPTEPPPAEYSESQGQNTSVADDSEQSMTSPDSTGGGQPGNKAGHDCHGEKGSMPGPKKLSKKICRSVLERKPVACRDLEGEARAKCLKLRKYRRRCKKLLGRN